VRCGGGWWIGESAARDSPSFNLYHGDAGGWYREVFWGVQCCASCQMPTQDVK
jgi:hypothetical protein